MLEESQNQRATALQVSGSLQRCRTLLERYRSKRTERFFFRRVEQLEKLVESQQEQLASREQLIDAMTQQHNAVVEEVQVTRSSWFDPRVGRNRRSRG